MVLYMLFQVLKVNLAPNVIVYVWQEDSAWTSFAAKAVSLSVVAVCAKTMNAVHIYPLKYYWLTVFCSGW